MKVYIVQDNPALEPLYYLSISRGLYFCYGGAHEWEQSYYHSLDQLNEQYKVVMSEACIDTLPEDILTGIYQFCLSL